MCKFCDNEDELQEYKMSEGGTICEDCLDKYSDLYYLCYGCNEVHSRVTEPETEINGEEYCPDCRDENFYECQDCGEWFSKDEGYTYNGHPLCENCYDENYTTCDRCGEIVYHNDATSINDGDEYWCENCKDEYAFQCEDCGCYYSEDNVRYINSGSGYHVCEHCFDRGDYCYCDDCGEYYYYDDGEYYDDDDRWYCNDCLENHQPKSILSYHQNWDIDYKYTDDDTKDDKDRYFGFELEVSGDRDYAEEFLSYFDNELVLMNDSSIVDGGFEIITQPMTYHYFYDVFLAKWEKGLQFLRDNDFTSHNKGGLHIHISEDMLEPEHLAELSKILYGSDKDIDTWLQITQRHKDKMERWSSMTDREHTYEDLKSGVYHRPSTSRYTALNYDDRTGTYEFRIFNGNIRIERFLKNFECVQALLDYVKQEVDEGTYNSSTTNFLKYITKSCEYPNLKAFLQERHIIHQHISNQYESELLEVA